MGFKSIGACGLLGRCDPMFIYEAPNGKSRQVCHRLNVCFVNEVVGVLPLCRINKEEESDGRCPHRIQLPESFM